MAIKQIEKNEPLWHQKINDNFNDLAQSLNEIGWGRQTYTN